MDANDLERARLRRITLIATVFGQIIGHISTAFIGWVLDYVAFRLSPTWVPIAVGLTVRNGRLAILLGAIANWLIGAQDTSFVFSMMMLVGLTAQPLVFPDLDIPATELWYSYSKSGPITLPTFVFSSIFFHYPRWTIAMVKFGLHKAVTDPPGVSQLLDWFWTALACVSVPYIIYTKIWPSRLFRVLLDIFWRGVGKVFYSIMSLRTSAGEVDASQPFEHPPLINEWDIRLLHVEPRGNSDRINCKLVTTDLGYSPPAYEAMSYTWGNPAKTHTIWIDGKPFKTTQNVYNLLFDRSPVFAPRKIWIDSICINQEDNIEKACQVSIMRQIYECASLVTVWLGEGKDSHLAVDLILELSHYLSTYTPTDTELYHKYVSQRRSPRWLAIGHVLAHPYFSRIWMVQEVAVNKTLHVVYGRETLKWDTLAPVLLRLFLSFEFSIMIEDSEVPDHKQMPIAATNSLLLHRVRKVYQGEDKETPGKLLELLTQCWTFKATDARDRVFALVGIATDGTHPLVAPDYNKTAEQVFLDTARYLFAQQDSLGELLCCAGVGWPREISSLPSWVPDWTTVDRSVIANFPTQKRGYQTNAGLTNRGPVIHEKSIELDVIIVDTIDRQTRDLRRPVIDPVTNLLNTEVNSANTRAWLREAQALYQTIQSETYVNGQHHEEAFWRTLVCDAPAIGPIESADGMEWPADAVYGLWYKYAVKHLVEYATAEKETNLSEDETYQQMQQGARWMTSAQLRCYSRRLAVSHNGYLSLVPALAEVGDVIAIIPGTTVPFVLRDKRYDQATDSNVYTLVGECYVHGIMNGEKADASEVEVIMLE